MDLKLSYNDIVSILLKMTNDMKEHIEELRELDAASGDGDLGVTVELGSNAMADYLNAPDEKDIGRMLAKLGMNANKANPSTFGTLLASAFMGAGKAVQSKAEIGVQDIVSMGFGAIDGIKKRGKAEVGDKTMLDALVPAVETFKKCIDEGNDVVTSLNKSAAAANTGMMATADMKAKFGRASYRPDSCIGIRDGGATAMYFLIDSIIKQLIASQNISK